MIDPARDDIYVPAGGSERNVYIVSRAYGTLKMPYGQFDEIPRRDEL